MKQWTEHGEKRGKKVKCVGWAKDPGMLTELVESIISKWQGELIKPPAQLNPPEVNLAEEDTFGLISREERRPPRISEMTKM